MRENLFEKPKSDSSEPEKSSRRDFLKNALKIGAGVLAGGTMIKVGIEGVKEANSEREKEEQQIKESLRISDGVIIEKKHYLPELQPVIGFDGKISMGMSYDSWSVIVEFDNFKKEVVVSAKDYESFDKGERVICKYLLDDNNEAEVKAIERKPEKEVK